MKKTTYYILMFFILISNAMPLFAQVVIDRPKIKEDISGGETIVDSITITNLSDNALIIKVSFEDIQYKAPYDGSKAFINPLVSQSKLATWLSFSPKEFTIAGKSLKKVTYSIKVPKDVASGGYYGVLFFAFSPKDGFSTTSDIKIERNARVDIIQRIGSLVFLETIDKTKQCKIGEVAGNKTGISMALENSGNVLVVANGVYYVMDKEGMVASRGKLKTLYLPIGAKATPSLDFADVAAGIYTAVVTFDLEDGEAAVREIDFEKNARGFHVIAVRE